MQRLVADRCTIPYTTVGKHTQVYTTLNSRNIIVYRQQGGGNITGGMTYVYVLSPYIRIVPDPDVLLGPQLRFFSAGRTVHCKNRTHRYRCTKTWVSDISGSTGQPGL